MPIKRIFVRSSAGPYSVVCGAGALGHAAKEIAKLGSFSSVHIVSSAKVWRAVGKDVQRGVGLKDAGAVHLMNDAETAKNLRTVELLTSELVRGGADRKSLIIAVGGGVVGDVAGFVAASYLRGVALVQVPTTVVAQVDSSIGGKTGVNLPEGKNLVGAFYPPRLVLSVPEVLRSLPEREFRSGLGEIIKHAAIADAEMFAYLEKHMTKVQRRDRAALEYLIPRNVAIKARIVTRDERESGLREILNFGHTFAHALESVTHYKRYQHGEVVRRMGPLPPWPRVPANNLIVAMRSDKKTRDGKLRFVLTPRIGKAGSYDGVPLSAVERVLRFAPRFFCDSGKVND